MPVIYQGFFEQYSAVVRDIDRHVVDRKLLMRDALQDMQEQGRRK